MKLFPEVYIMFNRNIFTSTKPYMLETVLDVILAVVIGLSLCALALYGLDALFA